MAWIKTLHILFVMGWMTCLFALPRVVLHWKQAAEAGKETEAIRALSIRLFRFGSLMALLAMGFGTWLWMGYGFGGTWLQRKLAMVALLIVYHMASGALLFRALRQGRFYGGVAIRLFNEGSLLVVIPIIYLVVAKPG